MMNDPTNIRLLEKMLAALPEDPARFAGLCGGIADWDALTASAERHRVFGVLIRPLAEAGGELPAEVRDRIRHYIMSERYEYSRLETGLNALLEGFLAAGIRAVALKGPVLAERIYPDPYARLSNDLDFLIRPEAVPQTRGMLAALGYREDPERDGFREHRFHHRFVKDGGVPVEVHYMLGTGFNCPFPSGPFMDRAVPYRTSQGRAVWTLSPVDEYLFLALHAAKHSFSQLILLYDLKLYHARHPGSDGPELYELGRRLRISTALSYAGHILHRRLSVDTKPPRYPRGPFIDYASDKAGSPTLPRFLRYLGAVALLALLCDDVVWTASLMRYYGDLWRGAKAETQSDP